MSGWLSRLFPDPRFCAKCGQPLERGESRNFNDQTGAPEPLPYAACPDLRVTREPGGGFTIRGGYPEHTAILREPRWTAAARLASDDTQEGR